MSDKLHIWIEGWPFFGSLPKPSKQVTGFLKDTVRTTVDSSPPAAAWKAATGRDVVGGQYNTNLGKATGGIAGLAGGFTVGVGKNIADGYTGGAVSGVLGATRSLTDTITNRGNTSGAANAVPTSSSSAFMQAKNAKTMQEQELTDEQKKKRTYIIVAVVAAVAVVVGVIWYMSKK